MCSLVFNLKILTFYGGFSLRLSGCKKMPEITVFTGIPADLEKINRVL
jgi:hypothetical protein